MGKKVVHHADVAGASSGLIFILALKLGFNGLDNDNSKARWEKIKLWNLVRRLLDAWRLFNNLANFVGRFINGRIYQSTYWEDGVTYHWLKSKLGVWLSDFAFFSLSSLYRLFICCGYHQLCFILVSCDHIYELYCVWQDLMQHQTMKSLYWHHCLASGCLVWVARRRGRRICVYIVHRYIEPIQ